MFDRNSRYHEIEEANLVVNAEDGSTREVPYITRRFIPQPPTHPPAGSHTVTEGERLDHIAARALADPTLFWHLVDGTDALDPDELTATPGSVIDIHLPGMGI